MSAFARDFREDRDINLGVGYVNENTIPRELVIEALQYVLAHPAKYRTALNYGRPRGSANLIDSIRQYHLQHRIGGLSEETLRKQTIIIGPNGATSLLEGLASVLRKGIVLTTDPMYYIYCNFLERSGFTVVTIPESDHGLEAAALQEKLGQLGDACRKISCVYVVTVNNPTGTILANTERRGLVTAVSNLSKKLGRSVPLVFDKAYEGLVHDPRVEALESGLLGDEMGIVYEIGTLSKILAPALRIGFMMGREGPLLCAMVQKTSDAGFSAPLINQEMASYLLDHHVEAQAERVRVGYRTKALALRGWIDEYLGDSIARRTGGQAGFYFYLTLVGIHTTERSPFFRFLTRTTGDDATDGVPPSRNPRVIYIPGEFCVHPQGSLVEEGRRQLRISYGFEESDRIRDALGHMQAAAAYARTVSTTP